MGGSFAVLVAALGAAPVNYELSLRTEGRTGTGALTANGILTASFLELDPAGLLSTSFGALSIRGGYRPRLLYSLNVDHTFTVLHQGSVGEIWRLSRKTGLSFDQSLSYGRNDFSPLLAPQGTTPQDPHLPPLVLEFFSASSSVGVNHSTLTGTQLGGSASYSLSGGLDQRARSLLPLSRSGTLAGNVAWEVTRADAVTSNALATVMTFTNGGEAVVGSVTLGWRRQFSRATQGEVSAGVSLMQSARPGVPGTVGTGPSASLGVSHRPSIFRRQEVRTTARVAYAAAIDPLGVGTYSRVEGSLGAEYTPMTWLSLILRGSGARGISGPPALRNGLAQLEFTSMFNIERHMAVGAGVRTAWLSNPAAFPSQTGFAWAAFLGITVRQEGKL